jgi:hypothetical protein
MTPAVTRSILQSNKGEKLMVMIDVGILEGLGGLC